MAGEPHESIDFTSFAPKDPVCREAVAIWLANIGAQLTDAYTQAEHSEPGKLDPLPLKAHFLTVLAEITGERELVDGMLKAVTSRTES